MRDKTAEVPAPATVLILVRDILGAGLIGALVEGTGKEPLFPIAGERAEVAVERLRPALILLDCYHSATRADAFFAAVESASSRIILFAPSAPWADFDDIARRPQVRAFVYPGPGESLADLLREALRRA
jgi:hypothetical protein